MSRKTRWMLSGLVGVVAVAVGGVVVVQFYPYLFAKHVTGKIQKVERVTNPTAVISTDAQAIAPQQLFSFAVSIRDDKGEIHTASSEDRQWAVVVSGQCVEAKFFPYPPWNLDKSGTFYGARLLRLFECPGAGATQ